MLLIYVLKALHISQDSSSRSHPSDQLYIDVIIPLAVRVAYSYEVPTELSEKITFGIRVEVPFGQKKLYAALIIDIHSNKPNYQTRKVRSVLDEQPIVTHEQIKLWKWIAKYYTCGLGEVMAAALPSMLKLHSETIVIPGSKLDEKIFDLEDKGYMIAEAVSIQKELTIDKIRDILQIKTVYPLVKSLIDNDVVAIKEELQQKYRAKQVTAVRTTAQYEQLEQSQVFSMIERSDHQTRAMLAIIQLSASNKNVRLDEILQAADVNHSVIGALEKKGLIERYRLEVSRIKTYAGDKEGVKALSADQKLALEAIGRCPSEQPVLLHGVTGSGKTRVYIEEIKSALTAGRQVLYLLPEIALTTQIVMRLQRVFGDQLLVYHSRLNESERVEVWRKIQGLPHVVLGARSSIFLPFSDLGLIIVDEEHDGSYKQSEPNPRYQARDTAIVLARFHQARIILGSATPSIESYQNTRSGKYRLVELRKRYGEIRMPEILVVDLKRVSKLGYFSRDLLDEIEHTHREGMQTILFQNRRGFAPMLLCTACAWSAMCKNCDTSLTYHKYINQMQCHFCAYHETPALLCPACGNHELTLRGFGTELIEDDIKIRLPELKVGRLDLDTARGKKRLQQIISSFENGALDILIGTQMVTKGLDFENVGLVGVINADQLLHYPDFRATERAFQLMTQVSGRAGRHKKQGRVVIQAYQTSHPVIKEVIQHDYASYFNREIEERRRFGFPPFSRIVEVTLKHGKAATVDRAGRSMAKYLKERLGSRIRGPLIPSVSRVRNKYLQVVTIKLEKDAQLIAKTKAWLLEIEAILAKQKGMSTLRVAINVDP